MVIELDGSSDAASEVEEDDDEDMSLAPPVPRARPPVHAAAASANQFGLDRFARGRSAMAPSASAYSPRPPSMARAPATPVMGEDDPSFSSASAAAAAGDLLTDEELLYELSEALKGARQSAAAVQGQTVWSICSNLSLEDLARKLPVNVQQLASCKGFGVAKANTFALAFLPTIHKFIVEHELEMPPSHQVPLQVYQQYNKTPPAHLLQQQQQQPPQQPLAAAPMGQLAPVFRAAAAAGVAQKSAISGSGMGRTSGYQLPLLASSSSSSSSSRGGVRPSAVNTSPHFSRSGSAAASAYSPAAAAATAVCGKRSRQMTELFGEDDEDLENEDPRPTSKPRRAT
jgi:hypothetical protein